MTEPAAPRPAPRAEDYSSTVIAPLQVVLGVASGAAIAVVLETLQPSLWPVAIVLFLAAAGTGWYLAPVSVHVDDKRITIGQGRRERDPLVIYVAEVRDAALRDLTWAQCLGFGIDDDDRTTRLAVRPGTTLQLLLHDGQRMLVSVADGPAAMLAIESGRARR